MDTMNVRGMHEANRRAWNEGAVRYTEWIDRDLERLRDGGTTLQPVEIEQLGDLRWCGRAIHLQCASGSDSLSLLNLGAGEVVGIDISDLHITNAERKSIALDVPARWIRADILDTPAELDGTADLVYTGKGALNWLHDLDTWAGVVARLLKPGGRLYLFEGHPVVWPFESQASTFVFEEGLGYFEDDPYVSRGWPERYIGELETPAAEQAQKYERNWPVSEVINSLIGAGLRLDRFTEHPDQYWDGFPNMPPETASRLPQTFALWMTRLD